MSTIIFLSKLRSLGVQLWIEGNDLRYQAPKGALPQHTLLELSERKYEIIEFLNKIKNEAKNIRQVITMRPNKMEDSPTSYSQQSLWFFDQYMPNNSVYNISNAIRMYGKLNIKVLENSIDLIVKRHEILRTTFAKINHKPVQKINVHSKFELEIIEMNNVSSKDREQESKKVLDVLAWSPFNLENGPLWRVQLLKFDEADYILSFTIHHIISDAWSNGIFIMELLKAYEAFSKGESIPLLPPLPIQFADYAYWQRNQIQNKEILLPLIEYWKNKLNGYPTLELPIDHPRPVTQNFSGKTVSILLSKELSENLKAICKKEKVTLFMLFLATFKTLLFRYSGQEDIIVGTVVANRNYSELSGLIGFIMNTLVLRSTFSEKCTFREVLQIVKSVTLEAYANQEMPFDILLEELKPTRDLSRTALFQVMYIHQNAADIEFKVNGLKIEPIEIENKSAPFDLRMNTQENQDEIACCIDYSTALYEEETIVRMLEHFRNLLESVTCNLSNKITELPLLSKYEIEHIAFDFNNTKEPFETDLLIYEMFEKQVEKSPNAIAVIFEGSQMTYNQLNIKANMLANYLKDLGIGPDSTVGICLERSFDLVISLFAVLKAGGAYVPFDPNYPKDRVLYMISDSRVKAMITIEKLYASIPVFDGEVILLDKVNESISNQSTKNLRREVTDNNLAYVIYTSGSTGNPKGAMNTHIGMRNHKQWMQKTYKITKDDKVLQKTPFSFDVSVWEFFWPLIYGAQLVVAKPEGHKDPQYLIKTIIDEQISVIHFVPSMLNVFLEQTNVYLCNSLKHVFCSGEALSAELQRHFYSKFRIPLHNVYGPAECADVCCAWTCDNNYHHRIVPIGKPISNVCVYILDKYNNHVPIGVSGEICISGVSIGLGYINNISLTKEKFVDPPSNIKPSTLMYKTGDIGRYRTDGNIEYIGRNDFQVKIRGLRIELGEIENKLLSHPQIKQAVVVAVDLGESNRQLASYIEKNGALTVKEVKGFLSEGLPEYMVPAYIIILEFLPLLPNGKIDRSLLPLPDKNIDIETEYEPPRNKIEEQMACIWQEVLNKDKVGINDNFFDLGGHSLLATIVISKIAKLFQITISFQGFFENPTIARLSEIFEKEILDEESENYDEGEL